ncbi:hypothetical protein [Agrobacterium tumefaciens]|uniref:hypothetical protein n=1 Tax=Agrobacterium tumefaciens TaxID=358 RepID=UPI001658E2B5|nr:hypothetical protein [Agrobacterium tumefaciens]QNP78372.1 hypothetical protein IAI05_07350 [Agrobacterium tumefaciens]
MTTTLEAMRADSPLSGHRAEWHFFRSYVGTALGTCYDGSNDCGGEPLDANHDISDLAPATLESMLADCSRFYDANKEHIHCSEREDYEAAARELGWTRNAHNGYFVAPVGSDVRMADYDDWEELCTANDIEPLVIPGAPLSREFEGSIAAREAAMAGHDFWLTRCGHGAGFWDGDWPEPAASVLTTASEEFGNVDLYVGDDGQIYA